jgi:CxxC motif-containing protein (DUF1111 family)
MGLARGCKIVFLTFISILSFAGCGSRGGDKTMSSSLLEPGEEFSGGETTVFDTTPQAFSLSARNLSFERRTTFLTGNSFFNNNWVTAPASTEALDGLGPVFNTRSCSACHLRDGRGTAQLESGQASPSLLFRLSLPGEDAHGDVIPEPNYGGQFNPQAILGISPEGDAVILYEEIEGSYEDGEIYTLRKPVYRFENLNYGPMHSETLVSPRVAPFVFGLGLLEAIPEETLLSLADPEDRDGDGISGRPNYVWDVTQSQKVMGRFGWKANQPSLLQQTAGAFLGDIGITSSLFPEQNCTEAEADCRAAPNGGEPELEDRILDRVVFYMRTLAVPARRDWDNPQVLEGKRTFQQIGCAKCHISSFQTGSWEEFPELSNQTIRPYTDLLLHDMGEDLADGRPDFEADGREWRTSPLWGIGLVETVNGHTQFLHDGRARNLQEAVLWHGGEAENSREQFRRLTKEEREKVILFLNSL